jgi:hypothetical protein
MNGVNKPSRQAMDATEEKPAPPDAVPEPVSCEADDGREERKPASFLEMLFREAEVIARNLKESGTRR